MRLKDDVSVEKTQEKDVLLIDGKFPEKSHFSCPRSLPIPTIWPDRPLLLRESRCHYGYNEASEAKPMQLHGESCPFETDLFKGNIVVRMKNSPGTGNYFKGKKRFSSIVISGQFKRKLNCGTIFTGQEFCHPIKTPGMFMSKALLKFFKVLAPLLVAEITPNETYFLSPIIQTVQTLTVTADPVNLTRDMTVTEDLTLLDGDFAEGKKMHKAIFSKRKKYFSNQKNLNQYAFDTSNYFTFEFYDDKVDLNAMQLLVLKKRFELAKYLNGQPLRFLSRVIEPGDNNLGKYLWNFEVWHEKQTAAMKVLNLRDV
eukprot:CAMPEP_0204822642 /NCGR_PEP_ID=MMETSP1346-20131115/839_1 /ASSEMBLY_ACC=CAM_ASM_000771 /TAXON_ID=215587 /ORGANISM="Aplanochytrium stocchinoi, Strain GSBS06" /LENGTH=312 /DNA_ID=CAMNT_0051948979 /DNA_START=436 /DNA_END=1374 /DNA_ORIENTATION=-